MIYALCVLAGLTAGIVTGAVGSLSLIGSCLTCVGKV